MQWLPLILILPYLILLTRIYTGLIKIKPYVTKSQPDILVSVIAACRNEEKNIRSLLKHISEQDYPPGSFECIVIDDNSIDSTFDSASAFKGIRNLNVIKNKGSGKKAAVKTGIEACSGDLIVTTDADCRPGNAWLKTIASFHSEFKPDLIIGPVMISRNSGFFNKFQELEFLSLQGITAGTAITGNPVMCNGANMAFTKMAWSGNNINLHDEKVSGDDVFLLHSLKKNKKSEIMWLESPEAIVKTCPSETSRSFFRQRARWISKAGYYNDSYTIILAIVTFVTVLIMPSLIIAGIFDPLFLLVFGGAFILKSIPDYLILRNTTSRYSRKDLMRWFLPSQLIYPFYVIVVSVKALFTRNRW